MYPVQARGILLQIWAITNIINGKRRWPDHATMFRVWLAVRSWMVCFMTTGTGGSQQEGLFW